MKLLISIVLLIATLNTHSNSQKESRNTSKLDVLNSRVSSSDVENSGRACNIPALAAYTVLTENKALPDPFTNIDGTRITTKDQWTCRRSETIAQLQQYELGEKPPKEGKVSGFSDGKTIDVKVQHNNQSISFTADIILPTSGKAPYPVMIGMGNSRLNNDALSKQGVAIINFPNNDIAEQKNGGSRGKGKFYHLYGNEHTASAMTAWAWGVSRLIDVLETTPSTNIDASRIGVTGCSRNGKGALIAGALDERIQLTIPQESGSGGTAAWRVSDAQKVDGQNVQTLSQIVTENVWLTESFKQFSNTANLLPFDHHQVLGLVAPRALLVIENTNQEWLGNVSTFTSAVAAHEIWKALGVPNRMGVSQVGGHNHCAFPKSQQTEVDAFIEQYLIGHSSKIPTNILKTDGSFKVDRKRWINWKTPKLK